jgi:crossover junction endodeoxyribonuclease RusA
MLSIHNRAKMIELILPLAPSANRYWRTGRGRTYVSDEAKSYREEVGWIIAQAGLEPITTPVTLWIEAYLWRADQDLDNREKALIDSLQVEHGGILIDDVQVNEIHIRKYFVQGKNKKQQAKMIVRIVADGGAEQWSQLWLQEAV